MKELMYVLYAVERRNDYASIYRVPVLAWVFQLANETRTCICPEGAACFPWWTYTM